MKRAEACRQNAFAVGRGFTPSVHALVYVLLAIVLLSVSGCAGVTLPREPVPVDDILRAEIPGMPEIRFWGPDRDLGVSGDLEESIRQEKPGTFPRSADGSLDYSVLVVSGGGANGAFGAGVLYGWTQTGTRPRFKLVTGISTGALLAPFAMLGPEYDTQLKEVYTSVTTEDIVRHRGPLRMLLSLLRSESAGDTEPLARLIARYVDEDLLASIARAHAGGQRLYIGTTHLDAQEFVVWNMGAIAASGGPDALELFRKVMLASASIPAVFPPVLFDVEVDGVPHDEMHVDGGVAVQMFYRGGWPDLDQAAEAVAGRELQSHGAVYVIRNGKVGPTPAPVPRRANAIAERSIAAMVRVSVHNDLHRIYWEARADNMDFNYVRIPDDFVAQHEEFFDPVEMRRLFDLGVSIATSPEPWRTTPPDFSERH